MFLKKKMTLEKPLSGVKKILEKHIRNGVPSGYVKEDAFRLYKWDTVRYKKLAALLVISGSLAGTEAQTQITIKMRPCLGVFLLSAFPAAGLFVELYHLIFRSGALPFVLCVLAFNLIVHLGIAWQMRECMTRLVKELQE